MEDVQLSNVDFTGDGVHADIHMCVAVSNSFMGALYAPTAAVNANTAILGKWPSGTQSKCNML